MTPQEVYNLYLNEVKTKEEEENEIAEIKKVWKQGMKEILGPLVKEGVHCEDAPNGQGLLVYKDPSCGGFIVSINESSRGLFFHESLRINVASTKLDIRLWTKPSDDEFDDAMTLRNFIITCARTFSCITPDKNQ